MKRKPPAAERQFTRANKALDDLIQAVKTDLTTTGSTPATEAVQLAEAMVKLPDKAASIAACALVRLAQQEPQ